MTKRREKKQEEARARALARVCGQFRYEIGPENSLRLGELLSPKATKPLR